MKTTVAQVSATAKAMNEAYKLAQAGQQSGAFPCRCGGQIHFTVGTAAHDTRGRCNSTCGLRWPL